MADEDAGRKGPGAAAVEGCNGREEERGRPSAERKTLNGEAAADRGAEERWMRGRRGGRNGARSESRGGRGSGRERWVCEMSPPLGLRSSSQGAALDLIDEEEG
jgi:hypothetical protein